MIIPVRRNKKFSFNNNITNWHYAGVGVSTFFNSLSEFFPAGERYFIRSVRAYLNDTPKGLHPIISAFIGQEAFHGREHERFNSLLNDHKFLLTLEKSLEYLSEHLPDSLNLAVTVSLEHITAILAQGLLENFESFDFSDDCMRDMWLWHALEETEHKAVAFDQYTIVIDQKFKAYMLRTISLVIATLIFAVLVIQRYGILLSKTDSFNVKEIVKTVKWLFVNPGILSKVIPLWFDWFKPSFHPWDHDNKFYLEQFKDLLDKKYEN